MEKYEQEFDIKKKTDNTVVFKPADNKPPLSNQIYINKFIFGIINGGEEPERVKITIEPL